MTKTTEAATPCECSNYDALIGEQLTEQNLADGNYEIFTTGCTATTRNLFAPGHDAKLKSFLIQHQVAGHDIRRGANEGVSVTATAEQHADRYAFAHMVTAGIAKAQAKADARATRAAARAEKAANRPERKKAANRPERKKAVAAGLVTPNEHDGNAARQAREAKAVSLAEIAKAEEAAHAEAEAKKVAEREASADWDDAKTAPTLEDEAAMNTQAREAREQGLSVAKVGRWEREGVISEDGRTFSYVSKSGKKEETRKFVLLRHL